MPKYQPPLSELITVNDIPESLSFLKDGINSVFSNLYFDNLEIDRGSNYSDIVYNLTLVSKTKLSLEFPGFGLGLVLNPSFTSGGTSQFDISLSYQLYILKYLHNFDLAGFDFTQTSFFGLLLQIGGVNNQYILSEIINQYYRNDDTEDPIQDFIDAFNTKYSPAPLLVKLSANEENEIIDDIVFQLTGTSNDFDIPGIALNGYIMGDSILESSSRIERFFSPSIGKFTVDNIKRMLIPQITASLKDLRVALEFPVSVLRKVGPNNEPIQIDGHDVPGSVSLDLGAILFSTENGFELSVASNPNIDFTKSEILNTGFTLEINEMRLDLSRTSNIPEATADGRPMDFMGVYVTDATIGLPTTWNLSNNTSTALIKARNLLIGTGGISGTLSLEAKTGVATTPLLNLKLGSFTAELNAFALTFHQNSIKSCIIKGDLAFPDKFKKGSTTQRAEIPIDVKGLNNLRPRNKKEGRHIELVLTKCDVEYLLNNTNKGALDAVASLRIPQYNISKLTKKNYRKLRKIPLKDFH